MKDHALKQSRSARNGQFVLTGKRGETISAVEGLKLSDRMRSVMTQATAQGLSGEQRRAGVKRLLGKK